MSTSQDRVATFIKSSKMQSNKWYVEMNGNQIVTVS